MEDVKDIGSVGKLVAEFDEWLGVSDAAGSPRSYREYLRASRRRQARPDAVKNVNNFAAGP